MRIDYDPNLIEQTVLEATHSDRRLQRDLHRVVDPLYELADSEKKNARFQQVYTEFFQLLNLDRILSDLIDEQPLIQQSVEQCVIRPAPTPRKEAAELYVRPIADDSQDQCTLMIQVCPRSLLHPDKLAPRFRRELMHVADMLDPQFGYEKKSLTGNTPRINLIRDRFRVLWDICVEGRLAYKGHHDKRMEDMLSAQLERVFAQPANSQEAFQMVYQSDKLTHAQLLNWATSPSELFNTLEVTEGNRNGNLCPMCGFPTFDWFDSPTELDLIAPTIKKSFADWNPDQGVCRQCAEIYSGVQKASDRILS